MVCIPSDREMFSPGETRAMLMFTVDLGILGPCIDSHKVP